MDRAAACRAEGRGFKSLHPRHERLWPNWLGEWLQTTRDVGSSPTGLSICEYRPKEGPQASNLMMWVRFPLLAPRKGKPIGDGSGLENRRA